MEPHNKISDQAHLRSVYRNPGQAVIDKVIDHIDAGAADFIAKSPFVVLATATEERADSSPRGGPPGFVRVLDQQHLAWGDLTGNNRLDTFNNVLAHSKLGLLFIIPTVEETLRVFGSAELVQDPEIVGACAIDGRKPKTAVVVRVQECYIQCGAALRRSGLWNPATWPAAESRPSAGAILKEHIGTENSAEEIEAGLQNYYNNHIWVAGGRHD